jgi:hypothetical protein
MGARRFAPDTGRFLEQDFYREALSDLELSYDALTENRYGFAGGNPISFVESDGHDPRWYDYNRRGAARKRALRMSEEYSDAPDTRPISMRPSLERRASIAERNRAWAARHRKKGGGFLASLARHGHTVLDVGGAVPVVGEPADLINCGWYGFQGRKTEAAFSCTAAIPGPVGWGATLGKAGYKGAKAAKAARAPRALRGEFSIVDWSGYPVGIPRPRGPMRLLAGEEYDVARAAANRANAQLRRANPERYRGKHIHEIHPVKFCGNPTDPANKIALTPQEHYRLNEFWRRHQRYATGSR